MAKGNSNTPVALNILVTGFKIRKKGSVKIFGLMARHTKEATSRAISMDEAS